MFSMFARSLPVLLALGVLSSLAATEAQAARKLHVIVAADTQDGKIGKFAQADSAMIGDMLSSNVHESELEFVFVEPDQMTRQGLQQTIQGLQINAEDAVLFYYTGHGAYANDDQHYLVTRSGQEWISRALISQSLRNRGAGLVVLLTDACANFSSVKPEQQEQYAMSKMLDATKPLFRKLFFQTNGFVDVNSCKKDQVAMTNPDETEGSIFTAALTVVARQNQNAELSWDQVLNSVAKETSAKFKEICGDGREVAKGDGSVYVQTTQTVARLAVQVEDFTPGSGSGSEPPPVGPQETQSRDIVIDPKSGQVFEVVVHVRYFPDTGKIQTWNDAPKHIGQAKLVYASDGTAYYRYRSIGTSYYVLAEAASNNGNPGQVASQRFGLTVREVTDGIEVASVVANGPSQHCFDAQGKTWRLEVGDLITHINGQAINTLNEFANAVRNSPRRMTFRASDRQQPITLSVDLNNLPNNGNGNPPPAGGVRFGVAVVENNGVGVLVQTVQRGSPATKLRSQGKIWQLEAGDVIESVNGQAVSSVAEFAQALKSSPRTMRLEVRGPDGKFAEFVVTLNN